MSFLQLVVLEVRQTQDFQVHQVVPGTEEIVIETIFMADQ